MANGHVNMILLCQKVQCGDGLLHSKNPEPTDDLCGQSPFWSA